MKPTEAVRRVLAMRLPRAKQDLVLGLVLDIIDGQWPSNDAEPKPNDAENDAEQNPAENLPLSPDKERSPRPPKEINPNPHTQNARDDAELLAEFEHHFWPTYPHRVGKPDAVNAFVKARKGTRVRGKPPRKPASLERILDGLKRYRQAKPDSHSWLNPATFLNQERWNDEPGEAPSAQGPPTKDGWSQVMRELEQGESDDPGTHEHDGRTIEASAANPGSVTNH